MIMKPLYEIAWKLLDNTKHDYTLSDLHELTSLDLELVTKMQKKFVIYQSILQALKMTKDCISEYDALEEIGSKIIEKDEKRIEKLHQEIKYLRESISMIDQVIYEIQSNIKPWNEFTILAEEKHHDPL